MSKGPTTPYRNLEEEKLWFNRQIIIYSAIMFTLAILNFLTTPEHLWVLYPASGWGMALVFWAREIAKRSEVEDEYRRQTTGLMGEEELGHFHLMPPPKEAPRQTYQETDDEDYLDLDAFNPPKKEKVQLPKMWDDRDFV